MADEVVIPHRPSTFTGIPDLYEHYTEVSDDVMMAILDKWMSSHAAHPTDIQTLTMKLTNDDQQSICCEVDLPPGADRGSGPFPAVIFAHGYESNARSPRNLPISRRLAMRNVIGVRVDFTGHGHSEGLLEDATDERMLRDLRIVHEQVANLHEVDEQRIGINGSGTGGMIALQYAAGHDDLEALVIRGPVCGDEIDAAKSVTAPTLLIHAERDTALCSGVEALDRQLHTTHELLRIPDSSRLFNDPISLELMIDASVDWLVDHLRPNITAVPARAKTSSS
jgi:dienelactone hydrolase